MSCTTSCANSPVSKPDRTCPKSDLVPSPASSTWYATALRVVDGRWNATSTTAAAVPPLDGLHLNNAEEADAWLAAEHGNVLALAEVATGPDAADMCMAFGHAWEHFGKHYSAEWLYRSAARICSEIGDERGAAVAFDHVRAIHLARMSCPTG